MAETALAIATPANLPTIEAWAVSSVFSPFPGSAGVSASAWMISFDQWNTPVQPIALASREANRDQWYASIKAIAGVVEDVPGGSAVRIFVVEEKLEPLFKRGWLNANGKPASGFEAAGQIYADIKSKKLIVDVVYRSADDIASVVKQAARAKAGERYRSLPDERLAEAPSFKRTKAKNRNKRGFPVLRGDETEH